MNADEEQAEEYKKYIEEIIITITTGDVDEDM